MSPHSVKLKDRTLWIDGDSSFDADTILDSIRQYEDVKFVNKITPLIEQFNATVLPDDKIVVKTSPQPLSFEWNIPTKYKTLDVKKYLLKALECEFEHIADKTNAWEQRIARLTEEYKLYSQMNLIPVLQTIIYVINTLAANNVVWGVGRGSSVASYVLYLIGAHDVDSVMYDLDYRDFLHE